MYLRLYEHCEKIRNCTNLDFVSSELQFSDKNAADTPCGSSNKHSCEFRIGCGEVTHGSSHHNLFVVKFITRPSGACQLSKIGQTAPHIIKELTWSSSKSNRIYIIQTQHHLHLARSCIVSFWEQHIHITAQVESLKLQKFRVFESFTNPLVSSLR